MDDRQGQDRPAICPKCRHVSPAGSHFCNLCGRPIAGEAGAMLSPAALLNQGQSQLDEPYYMPDPPKRSKATAIFVSILLFIFLAPIIGGICAIGGCFVSAFAGGDEVPITAGLILGVVASLVICATTFRSMTNA